MKETNEQVKEPARTKITHKDYKVQTADNEEKIITVRREHTPAHHDREQHCFVPTITLLYLDSVNGKKYDEKECTVRISNTNITLKTDSEIQYLKRVDVSAEAKRVQDEWDRMECMTGYELASEYERELHDDY